MSPFSGTHLRLSCFGFSLTNTIFERAYLAVKVRDKLTRYEADKLKVSLQVALSQVEE